MAPLDSCLSEKAPLEDTMEKTWCENLLTVLMADDDEDDYILVKSAFEAGPFTVDLRWVRDGQEAMDYLRHAGIYRAGGSSPRPDLILLDLIMPEKDGLETLKEIKGDRSLQRIPIVLLTTSRKQEHKSSGLKLGADSFIVKPHDFSDMVKIMSALHEHYFGIVRLPEKVTRPAFVRGERYATPSANRILCHADQI